MHVHRFGLLFIMSSMVSICFSLNETGTSEGSPTKILSRRKRFLVFPEGSSFQLVFCTQTQGYLQIGDIIWFGNTASLAWELPEDPSIFHMFLNQKKQSALRRNDVSKSIYYLNDAGKVIAKVPYKKKPIVNPAFAKRSIDDSTEETARIRTVFIRQMHEVQKNRTLFEDIEESAIKFHRAGRVTLYEKLETFIDALGWSGRDCINQMLCEHGQIDNNVQGSFFKEILRATFTFPSAKSSLDNHHVYDRAHRSAGDCVIRHPNCKQQNKYAILTS